jgi:hypothetical protein
VEIAVTRRTSTGEPSSSRQAVRRLDRADWTRVACHIGRRRLRCGAWDDAEILGALQAWAETHGRSPTSIDWVKADVDRPNSLTVRRHFRNWTRMLRLAGLQPYVPATQPRNFAWTDSEVIQALRDWAAEHGRPPEWHEWLRSAPGRPCNQTVREHFGSWNLGLTAAGL